MRTIKFRCASSSIGNKLAFQCLAKVTTVSDEIRRAVGRESSRRLHWKLFCSGENKLS